MYGQRIACLLLALLAGGTAWAENVDPANDGSQYAYSENRGWINAEPSGDGGPGMQVDDFAVTGHLWGENLGWISLSCANRGVCGSSDYGVTNSGHGNLAGYAWAENGGWISFSCENTSSCGTASYEVTVDPVTGEVDGRAWGENIGWVSFRSTGAEPFGVTTDWCQATAAAPTGSPVLFPRPNDLFIWPPVPAAAWYEAVRGTLSELRAAGGDFSAATDVCLFHDQAGTTYTPTEIPPLGDGFWFFVRAANCKGNATYDSGGSAQPVGRDALVAASGADCP